MAERGVIRNRQYAQQLRDFSGLRFGNITPTDIDGFLDFGDRLFVLIEGKHAGSPMQRGQLLALQRLVDACHCPPQRISAGLIVDHYDGHEADVDVGSCVVRSWRWMGEWRKPLVAGITCRQAIERLIGMRDRLCKPNLRLVCGGA